MRLVREAIAAGVMPRMTVTRTLMQILVSSMVPSYYFTMLVLVPSPYDEV